VSSGTGTRIVDNAKAAEATLVVLNELREKSILSLSGGGRVSEYQLRYRMSYRLLDKNAVETFPATEIDLKRDFSYSDTEALSKESEEALLFRDMQSDAVQQLVRRLQVVRLKPAS
jgi:LPS-assembly lipoprotein